jgi:hypothetical protein
MAGRLWGRNLRHFFNFEHEMNCSLTGRSASGNHILILLRHDKIKNDFHRQRLEILPKNIRNLRKESNRYEYDSIYQHHIFMIDNLESNCFAKTREERDKDFDNLKDSRRLCPHIRAFSHICIANHKNFFRYGLL